MSDVQVTQEDREAATKWLHQYINGSDWSALASAFARHRLATRPALDVDGLVEALRWYGEQARLCRLIHTEGDAGRVALAEDGGKRALAAIKDATDAQ